MIKGFVISFLALTLALGALASGAGLWLAYGNPDTSRFAALEPQVLPAIDQYREVAMLDVVLAAEENGSRQFFTCQGLVCKPSPQPLGLSSAALFDGTAWYYYESDGSLRRQIPGSDSTLIVSSTDLVTPRDMVVHPSAKRLAYWLDNNRRSEDLTELWVYDGDEGGTKVVAEKVVASDVITRPRWNGAGTNLFFVADSGVGESEKLEFVVALPNTAKIQAQFFGVDVGLLQSAIQTGVIDTSVSGLAVAFASSNEKGDILHIAREGASTSVTPLVGRIPFVQWLGEGNLLYVIQRGSEIQFVRWADATHTVIGREQGKFISAKVSETGDAVAYVSNDGLLGTRLHAFEISSGLGRVQAVIEEALTEIQVVSAQPAVAKVAGVTIELSDGQVIAFIDKHIDQIAEPQARPVRVIMTDKANTAFLDYETAAKDSHRILVTIYDAVHPEWVIQARYEAQAGQWQPISGAGGDATPQKVYEWEEDANQWILKAHLDK
jgi:hypothetical protein